MKFFSSALVLALCAAVVSADVATVQADVAAIDTGVKNLDTALSQTNLNYFSALAIHSSAQQLDDTVKKSTADVNALTATVSEDVAQGIIDTLTGTEKNIASAVTKLIAIKPQFDRLGVTGLARADVNNLAADTKLFGAALINKAPATKVAAATTLLNQVNTDLNQAVVAYA